KPEPDQLSRWRLTAERGAQLRKNHRQLGPIEVEQMVQHRVLHCAPALHLRRRKPHRPELTQPRNQQLRLRTFQANANHRAVRARVPGGSLQPVQPGTVWKSKYPSNDSGELDIRRHHYANKQPEADPARTSAQVLIRISHSVRGGITWGAFRGKLQKRL